MYKIFPMIPRTSRHFKIFVGVLLAAFLLLSGYWLLAVSKYGVRSSISLSDDPERPYLSNEGNYYMLDSIAGHIHRPDVTRSIKWAEHKNGKVSMKTNNLGFRNDMNTDAEKADGTIRVIVTGDSHVDGVINNDESLAFQLGRLLNGDDRGGARYEVLNGGVGYYTFQNYKGLLDRFLYLKPDIFIVVTYMGNDFMDALRFAERTKELSIPSRSKAYFARLHSALDLGFRARAPIMQAFNQIYFFSQYPDMQDRALGIAQREIEEMQGICRRNNIALVIALLPTKVDVEPQSDSALIKNVSNNLHLSEKDLSINRLLAARLDKFLSERGIVYIDLFEPMKSESQNHGDLYWTQDYHLNDKGHAFVAGALYKPALASSPGQK